MENQLVLNLGPALMPDFATGALFDAILAFPTVKESVSFHKLSEELMAGVFCATKAQDPDLAKALMETWPNLNWPAIEARARKHKPALGYLKKRLDQRMAAARAGIGIMHLQLFGHDAELPPGMTSASINQLCALIKSDTSIDDPENVEKLVWRKSLPVIHLAIATQLMLAGLKSDCRTKPIELQDIDFFRNTVQLAMQIERAVHDHPNIDMTSNQMTLVRWFE